MLRRGRVVGPDGQPVADALIGVEWGTAAVPEIAVMADRSGRLLLDLPRGRFRLWTRAPDGRRNTVEIEVTDSDEEIVLQIEEPASG